MAAVSNTDSEFARDAQVTGKTGSVAVPATGQTNATVAAAAPEDSRDTEFKIENLGGKLDIKDADEAAWTVFVHALISSAEFRYLR